MKKIIIGFALLGILILLLLISWRRMWIDLPFGYVPTNHARVDFYNESNQRIKTIQLVCPSGKQEVGPIEQHQKKIVTFQHTGEGSFQCTVIFDSGKTLQDREGYIEEGYHLQKHVSDNEIRTVF